MAGDEYPGDTAAGESADEMCSESADQIMRDVVDHTPFESLTVSVLYPTEESWIQADDRGVTCLVVAPAVGPQLVGRLFPPAR